MQSYIEKEDTHMVRSMTGYGKGIAENSDARVTIEMKSVNHRYLDLNIKLPKKLNFLESTIRNKISESVFRGKVDVYITLNEHSDACYQVSINDAIAQKYYDSISAMADKLGIDNDMKASSISRLPDVIELEEMEADEDSLKALVLEALDACVAQFVDSRIAEVIQCSILKLRDGQHEWVGLGVVDDLLCVIHYLIEDFLRLHGECKQRSEQGK